MQDPSKPIWINKQTIAPTGKPIIFVATPVHSECSIHYTQALLKFQQACMSNGIMVSFSLLKSSLVTQGRNLCVSNFMEAAEPYTHFLFIDSDIEFKPETIFSMIEADKDVIAAPYPLKSIDWNKIHVRVKDKIETMSPELLAKMGFIIKRNVFEKMIKAYPDLKIEQPTMINGKEDTRPYYYNFFDTYHEPGTKRYYGEDFGFCKRWTQIGGKCYLYVLDDIVHIGEYRYEGNLMVDMQTNLKKIDDSNKIK
jgi:hypothetical protein